MMVNDRKSSLVIVHSMGNGGNGKMKKTVHSAVHDAYTREIQVLHPDFLVLKICRKALVAWRLKQLGFPGPFSHQPVVLLGTGSYPRSNPLRIHRSRTASQVAPWSEEIPFLRHRGSLWRLVSAGVAGGVATRATYGGFLSHWEAHRYGWSIAINGY